MSAPHPETMSLADVQTELRAISGTPLRTDEDHLLRRQALWKRLDLLTAEMPIETVNAPCDSFEHYCHCGKWAAFGCGVDLRHGREGTWYCAAHRQKVSNRQAAE
jgi:hypothetical protein